MIKISTIKNIMITIIKSNRSLIDQNLGGLLPFFWGLILFSILMVFINAVSPLAPFVYSLF